MTCLHKAKKKNCYVARHPTKIWKLGRSVGIFFFFFFFLRTVRELSFPIFFLKFLNGENSGGMQSRIYKSCKCFFKPLNTNFSKFFAQIWHKKKKKKKNRPCFFAFYGPGEGNINIFCFLANNHDQILEFLRKIFLKGFQIYQNYLCALSS